MWSFSKETSTPVANNRERDRRATGRVAVKVTTMKNRVQVKIFWTISQTSLTLNASQFKHCLVLHFQERWYKEYPWLHYSHAVKGILCFYCVKTYTVQKSIVSKKADPAFSSKGFTNWKNALERFERHQHSQSHHHAVTASAQKAAPINSQLSTAWSKQQQNARHCLQSIVGSMQFLIRQGLALRGHGKEDGLFF